MGDACPIPLDVSNAATLHWLGLVALLVLAVILVVVGALLHARVRVEMLEHENERLRNAPLPHDRGSTASYHRGAHDLP